MTPRITPVRMVRPMSRVPRPSSVPNRRMASAHIAATSSRNFGRSGMAAKPAMPKPATRAVCSSTYSASNPMIDGVSTRFAATV